MEFGLKSLLHKKRRGGISVFLCIILTALIFFSGLMIDAARIMAAERKVQSALNTSVRSVLAGYSESLSSGYGIFGIASPQKSKQTGTEFLKYLKINLEDKNNIPSLAECEIIAGDLTSLKVFGSLMNDGVLKNQISEYMKYRMPLTLSRDIFDRFLKSGLMNKLEFAKKEKYLRKTRNELINNINSLNSVIKEIGGLQILNLSDLELAGAKLQIAFGIISDIEKLSTRYGIADKDAAKAALDGGAAPTGTEFASLGDDIGHLRASLNDIAIRLDSAVSAIRELENDITGLEDKLKAINGEEPGENGNSGSSESVESTEDENGTFEIESLIEAKKLAIEEVLKNINIKPAEEIKLSEPENNEGPVDSGGDAEGLAAVINGLRNDMLKYSVKIDPAWLIQGIDLKKANDADSYYYAEMQNSIQDTASIPEASEAEIRNDGIMAFFERFMDGLKKAAGQGIEKACIIEYIMDKFSNVTGENMSGHYFEKGEVEYILSGKHNQLDCIEEILMKIAALRFSIDTIDYFATSKNPHPLFRLIYALGRGFIQSCKDTYELYKGKTIAICPSLQNKSDIFGINYEDILRIFLAFQPEEEQLSNLKQLLQVNLKQLDAGFKLKDCNTVVRGKTTVKLKLWFIPLIKLEKLGIKGFEDNYYIIRKIFYSGY